MKKLTNALVLIVLTLTLTACGNTATKKYMGQAKTSIESKEYDKALASLELALDEDSKNDEAKKLYDIVDGYQKSKKLMDQSNIDEAKKVLDAINSDYTNYSIKEDIDSLKTQIEEKIKEIETTNSKITQLESLINDKKYDEAKVLIEELNKSTLNDTQKNKVNELKTKIDSELAKIEADKKAEQQRIAEEQKKKEQANAIPTTEYPSFTENTNFSADGYVMYKGIKLPRDLNNFTQDLMHEVATNLPLDEAFKVFKNYGYSDRGASEYIYKVKNNIK